MPALTLYDQLGRQLDAYTLVPGITLANWLSEHVSNYADLPVPPYHAVLNGRPWPYVQHGEYVLQDGDRVEMTLRARDASLLLNYFYYEAANGFYQAITFEPPKYQSSSPSGASSYNINVRANRARVNGAIPQVAGSFPRFPDLLSGIRRTFEGGKEVLYLMYSLGVGRYNTAATHVYISETPVGQYHDEAQVAFYAPGDDVSADEAAQNWYTSKEIGGSRASNGLSLRHPPGAIVQTYDFVDTEMYTYNSSGDPISPNGDVNDIITVDTGPEAVLGYYVITAKNSVTPFDITLEKLLSPNASDVDPDWTGFGSTGYLNIKADVHLVPSVDAGPWSNWYQLAPQGEDVHAVEVDYEYPRGIWGVSGSGSSIVTNGVYWELEINHDAGSDMQEVSTLAADQSPLRYTYRKDYGAPITNPRIRFRRRSKEVDRNVGQDVNIVRVKSRLDQNDSYPTVSAMTLRLVGTDTLAASGENQINVRGDSRMLPTLANLKDHLENATALSYSATSSIARFVAWTLFDMLGSEALNVIDWPRFEALETLWASRGDELNGEFTDETTLWEALKIMLAVGFAEPLPREGKITIVRTALGDDYQHMYTPDVMIDEGVQWSEAWYNDAEPDGIDVEYVDPATGKPVVVECRLPGDVGINPKRRQLIGVTGRTQAWRIGMRERRRLHYKPATLTFSTELDALNSLPGDAVAIASDLDAEQYGVVRGFDGIDTVTVDRALEFIDGSTYYAAFRKSTGRMSDLFEVTPGSSAYDMVLSQPSNLDFEFELDPSREPTLFSVGEAGRWSTRAIVREVTPSGFAEGKPKVALVAEEYLADLFADDDNVPV